MKQKKLNTKSEMQIKIEKPQIYTLRLNNPLGYELFINETKTKFKKPASAPKIAKLYTISLNKKLIYAGITSRPFAARLRDGFQATGKNGYHGYKWKDIKADIVLHIWTANENAKLINLDEMKIIEAEVVFLCRAKSGQWPEYQTEIHFYPSLEKHRKAAELIYDYVVTKGA